jgi:hypothetical protein
VFSVFPGTPRHRATKKSGEARASPLLNRYFGALLGGALG